jgi:hypothetical protein
VRSSKHCTLYVLRNKKKRYKFQSRVANMCARYCTLSRFTDIFIPALYFRHNCLQTFVTAFYSNTNIMCSTHIAHYIPLVIIIPRAVFRVREVLAKVDPASNYDPDTLLEKQYNIADHRYM